MDAAAFSDAFSAVRFSDDDPEVFVPDRLLAALRDTDWAKSITAAARTPDLVEASCCLEGGRRTVTGGAYIKVTPAALRVYRATVHPLLRSSDRHTAASAEQFITDTREQ